MGDSNVDGEISLTMKKIAAMRIPDRLIQDPQMHWKMRLKKAD
jgi:hypothetical protein